ncbi:MAG: adaptor protein MecA [Lachnospiraceae bacterium]|nr:adaptor protein MecA [Lachnospiraceae bacterium]
MRVERIDDKTVKCYLTVNELMEYNINYNDFVTRSSKAREVIREIMVQAHEELGYVPSGMAFDLQIVFSPENGMELTFSEKGPQDFTAEQVENALAEMRELLTKLRKDREGAQNEARQKSKSAKTPDEDEPESPEEAIFAFKKMTDLMDFSAVLPKNIRIATELYELDDTLYLYLAKGGASYDKYSRACLSALEYGVLYGAEPERIEYIKNKGKVIIPDRAINKLR